MGLALFLLSSAERNSPRLPRFTSSVAPPCHVPSASLTGKGWSDLDASDQPIFCVEG